MKAVQDFEFSKEMDCINFVQHILEEFGGFNIKRDHEPKPNGKPKDHIYCFPQFVQVYEGPVDWDVVLMKRIEGNHVLLAGHCGVFIEDQIIHLEEDFGPVCQKYLDPKINKRVTGILRYDQSKA